MTGLRSVMREGPIGASPSRVSWLARVGSAEATAFRSAPAQKTPAAPVRMATDREESDSKAVNAATRAEAVGPSTALRAEGRSMVTIRTGPSASVWTVFTVQATIPGVARGPPAWVLPVRRHPQVEHTR